MLAALQGASTCPGLGDFLHRSLLPSRDVVVPERLGTDLLPCPPPLWGRWTKASSLSPPRRRRWRFFEGESPVHAAPGDWTQLADTWVLQVAP